MERCISLLIVGVVATCCSQAPQAQVTVGWESSESTVREDAGSVELCAEVKSNSSVTTFSHTIRIVYEERNAGEGGDYTATPVNFTLTNAAQRFCFSVPIIDDTVFELTENFFVNLTTMGSGVILNPQLLIATIEDDDEVTIRSERTEITVREEEGSVEVCGILDGTLAVSLPRLNFLVVPGTARESMDYIIGRTRILTFEVGQPLRQCFTYQVVPDIAFEGDEMFQVILRTDNILPQRVILSDVTISVTILDYNVITSQQPVNTSTGFANLINTILPENTRCSLLQSDGVKCERVGEILQLSPSACKKSLVVVVLDTNGTVLVNESLSSSQQSQQIQYMIAEERREFNIFVQSVQYNGDYFILSLDDSLTGLQLPDTAIPLNCSRRSMATDHNPDGDSKLDDNKDDGSNTITDGSNTIDDGDDDSDNIDDDSDNIDNDSDNIDNDSDNIDDYSDEIVPEDSVPTFLTLLRVPIYITAGLLGSTAIAVLFVFLIGVCACAATKRRMNRQKDSSPSDYTECDVIAN